MKILGNLILLSGLAWAGLGMANVWIAATEDPTALAITIVVNGVLMIIPGLMLAGVGGLLARKRS